MIKSSFFFLFIAPFFAISVIVFYVSSYVGLINFISGYLSTLIVFAATSFGYRQMVQGSSKLEAYNSEYDDVDKIGDRFELWDDELYSAKESVKEVFEEEKKRLKKSKKGFKDFFKNAKPAISIYRILAYAILALVVYKLIKMDIFNPLAFLLGVSVAPLVVILYLYKSRYRSKI